MSVVKPLHKKCEKTNGTNYKLISLLTAYFQVHEKVMCGIVGYHMHTNYILVPEKIGFRKGICTENEAFKLIEKSVKVC
jgi:hypothetical protein